jgi:hypothetical protein
MKNCPIPRKTKSIYVSLTGHLKLISMADEEVCRLSLAFCLPQKSMFYHYKFATYVSERYLWNNHLFLSFL